MKIYLIPIVTTNTSRGPKYFVRRFVDVGIICRWNMMDYGFVPYGLLVAHDISQADHDALILNADVWAFPDNLNAPVTQTIQPFFEGINLPTDWLTPATTYLELLRKVAGMMQFNQRYAGISGGHSIFESATLNTRLRQMTTQQQGWFDATVASFGLPAVTNRNTQLRLLVRQASNYWSGQTFYMGGVEF